MSGSETNEDPHPHFEDNTDVFVVRIWQEPAARAPYTVRGVIEHMATGRRRFFSEVETLNTFIFTFAPGLGASDVRTPHSTPRSGPLVRLFRLLHSAPKCRRD